MIRRAKLLVFLAAFISFLLSVYLWFAGQQQTALFVGLWVPSILGLGGLMIAGYSVDQIRD
ncbi:MAG: hypothetical protein FJ034_07155 [Chloroflexi bacterium]|nr:hypothetical protein [Chloroflexota bacterium]